MNTTKRIDPRGISRTIKTSTFSPSATLVTYEECDHVGEKNATMTFKVGSQCFCFQCGVEARAQAQS